MQGGNFSTPDSIRYVGTDTIIDMGFIFVGAAHWICESWYNQVRFDLTNNSDNYYEWIAPITGDGTNCAPIAGVVIGGTYSKVTNQYLPKNSPIHAEYGVEPIPPLNKVTSNK